MSAVLRPDTAADRARLERGLDILGRLAEAGLEIAIAIEAQAKGGEVVIQGDLAMAYSRVARAVRQSLMLQSRLIQGLHDRETDCAARKAVAGASAVRIVGAAIEDDAGSDRERAERLGREAAERLQVEDFGDLLARPFGEVVAEICKDLGLSPDWLALAEDCFAAEQALHLRPGSAPPKGEADWRQGEVEVVWLDSKTNSS